MNRRVVAYLGASFVPFALERTSSHVSSRSTTLDSGVPDCPVCHDGSIATRWTTAALGLVMEGWRARLI